MIRASIGLLMALLATMVIRGQQPADPAALAASVVTRLAAGNFADVAATFDEKMREALPEEKLRLTWTSIVASTGVFVRQEPGRVQAKGDYRVVIVPAEFEKAKADIQIVFNASNQVAGFFIRPAVSAAPFVDSPYVDRSAFTEREVTVDAGGWPLPGTLTLPVGDGPWPAIVLVHGSGPSDRDESIGPNKIFRDLAHGLGSKGIAVLRYEKRTKQHGQKIAALTTFTVKEETIDDAVAAVELLRKTPGIDRRRVFVAGHSLGGMVAPRIAGAGGTSIRGLIILAGAVRSLEQSIIDQSRYLAELDGTVSPEEKQQLDAYEQMAARIKTLKPTDPAVSTGLFSAPASYFVDLRDYNPPAAAAALSIPMLILQGGRDYQVTMDDFAKWKAALSSRPNVTFTDFPLANHLFITGTGRSSPSEYMAAAGHVSQNVITAIVDWMGALK